MPQTAKQYGWNIENIVRAIRCGEPRCLNAFTAAEVLAVAFDKCKDDIIRDIVALDRVLDEADTKRCVRGM